MRILLVFPRFKYISGQPPLGIAYLYSFLKKKIPLAEISVFDGTFARGRIRDFEETISGGKFDMVGFSVMSTMLDDFTTMSAMVRKLSPGSRIVVGGPQPTVDPDYFFANGLADCVVSGEGEEPLAEYAANSCSPMGIKGIYYKKGNDILFGGARDPISDIDDFPIPSREIFDMSSYVGVWNSMDAVSSSLRGTSAIVSRGCPYKCSFCQPTLRKIFGSRVRKHSPSRVVEEMRYLKERFNINAVMFEDDTFLIDRKWAAEVCDKMLAAALEMVWCCNVRADLCDRSMLGRMREAGLRKINIGIESASQRILDEVFDKGVTIGQVEEAVRIAKELELKVQGYFMIGHYSETEEDIRRTIDFASRLNIDEASFSITTPFPGTFLYDRDIDMIEAGSGQYDYYKDRVYKDSGLKVSAARVRSLNRLAYLRFYTRPGRLVSQFGHILSPNGLRKFLYKLQRV